MNILASGGFMDFMSTQLVQFLHYTGFANVEWGHIIMILIGLIFIFLGIKKEFEPLLLVPIGFGMIVGNIPFYPGLKIGIYEDGSVLHILYHVDAYRRCCSGGYLCCLYGCFGSGFPT